MPPPLHACQIINETGQAIYLKIVGHEKSAVYIPDLPGQNNAGILFAASPSNQITDNLYGGKRAVVAWNNSGQDIIALGEVNITGPTTIRVRVGSISTGGGGGGPL